MGRLKDAAAGLRTALQTLLAFRRTAFVKAVYKLMSASVLGQVVLLAAVPVLTRVYGPSAFAVYAVSSAVSIWASVAASGRYSFAIVIAESDRESSAATALSLWVTLGFSILLGLLAFLWVRHPIGGWQGTDMLTPSVLIWTVMGAIALGFSDIGLKWAVRRGRFDILGWTSFAGSATVVALQIAIGLLFPAWGLYGLIIGQALGRLLVCPIYLLADPKPLFEGLASVKLSDLGAVARRYWRLPAYAMPSGFVNQSSKQLPSLMFPALGGQVLGHYALCVRVLRGPLSFVSEAVGHVFFNRFTASRTEHARAARLYLLSLGGLFALTLPVAAVILLFGPSLFAFAFGEEWRTAGHYARMLLPLIIAEFVIGPTANVLQSYNKQGLLFAWVLWTAISTAVTLFIVVGKGKPELAIMTYSIVSFANYSLYAVLCLYVIRGRRQVNQAS